MHLTLEDVHEILRLLDDSPYDEMTLQTERFTVTLRRTSDAGWTQESLTAAKPQAEIESVAAMQRDAAAAPAGDPAAAQYHAVHAALPGTFYRAPKPGARPYVEVGSQVDEDSIVAIVETMKLMNSITAGCRGVVREILVDNGEMVEAGAVLLTLEPSAA